MKTPILLTFILLAAAPLATAQGSGNQAEQSYKAGLAAVEKGDQAAAKTAFEHALKLNPSHANARFHLLQLRGAGGRMAAKAREIKLQKVVLATVQFDDVSLQEALEAIDLLVRKATKEQFSPNFVVQDSTGELAEKKVTLQLKNVPAHMVLKYTLDLTQSAARYDEHAILIHPLPGTVGGGAEKPEAAE